MILVGPGNNGGDGLALARHLIIEGKKVFVYMLKEPKTSEAIENLKILKKLTDNIYFHKDGKYDIMKFCLEEYDLCLDAVFGNGLKRNLEGDIKEIISLVNKKAKNIVSIDIPSGLDANTGEILGISVKANKTIAIHNIKIGMENSKTTGEIEVIKIGIPSEDFKAREN